MVFRDVLGLYDAVVFVLKALEHFQGGRELDVWLCRFSPPLRRRAGRAGSHFVLAPEITLLFYRQLTLLSTVRELWFSPFASKIIK
jgi:hypothetical protein